MFSYYCTKNKPLLEDGKTIEQRNNRFQLHHQTWDLFLQAKQEQLKIQWKHIHQLFFLASNKNNPAQATENKHLALLPSLTKLMVWGKVTHGKTSKTQLLWASNNRQMLRWGSTWEKVVPRERIPVLLESTRHYRKSPKGIKLGSFTAVCTHLHEAANTRASRA